MSGFGVNAYRVFVLLLGVWTGAGIHESIQSHRAWYADPVAWLRFPAPEGLANAWPVTTMLLAAATLVALVVAWRRRGPGRGLALLTALGVAAVLGATFVWFVPQLGVLGSDLITDQDMIALSRLWIQLNLARQLVLVLLLFLGLVALGRLALPPEPEEAELEDEGVTED